MRYDYKCTECEKVESHWHGMNEEPEIKCSGCNSLMKKIITGGYVIIQRNINLDTGEFY